MKEVRISVRVDEVTDEDIEFIDNVLNRLFKTEEIVITTEEVSE
jgi:hypothetical protein